MDDLLVAVIFFLLGLLTGLTDAYFVARREAKEIEAEVRGDYT